MSSSVDDDILDEFDCEDDVYLGMIKQPKQNSKMRRIEELMEEKKLLRDLDDFADDEPVNFTDFDSISNDD